jgi:hypothetical protein
MSALGANALTLLDWAKRLDPDGKVPTIVELLSTTNEILMDMAWQEGNLPTGHRTTVRTGLPTVYWRLLNQGVQPSKSTTAQITEGCGMLEAWSEVDVKLVKLNGNLAAFRLSEAKAFLEAMNQELASTLIYGNAGLAPEEFSGLAVRYSSLSATNAQNIVNLGGTQDSPSDLTSIWLVAWGTDTVHGIFPKGSTAGIQHNDFGEQTVEVTAGVAGSRMRALQEQFTWDAGLVVKDWRHVVRICNIDVSDQKAVDLMTDPSPIFGGLDDAIERLPNRLGRPVFYVNRTIKTLLRKHARGVVGSGGGLTYENFDGRPILSYGGFPIRLVDAILTTETAVA